jgi:hypothetical protein
MNSPIVHFEFENNRARHRVLYENGDSETLAMTKVGPDLYRLEESSFVGDAVYGDVIQCKPTDDGSMLFEEIVERSKLVTQSGIFSREFLAMDRVRSILDSVMEAGGMWEQAFGGLLIVHTPAEIADAVSDRLRNASPTT